MLPLNNQFYNFIIRTESMLFSIPNLSHLMVELRESTAPVDSKSRTTKTLFINGVEIMKKSEYTGVGHSSSVPFKDPAVLLWLLNQSLQNR